MYRILLIILLINSFSLAQHRGLKVISKNISTGLEEEIKLYDNTFALIIGIDDYPNLGFNNQLEYAVSDAKAVAKSLDNNFQFNEITTLYNNEATKNNILKALSKYRATEDEDGIFIFFAGHGYTEATKEGNLGYIIPNDGSMDPIEMYSNLSMNKIKELFKPINAKHIFFVVDACYSGTLFKKRSIQDQPLVDLAYLKEKTRNRVRLGLTAGGQNQQVLDGGPGGHSVFTGYFLEFLENASTYITASQLGYLVPEKVFSIAQERNHTQSPRFGSLVGDGDFVFIPKKAAHSLEKKTVELLGKLKVATIQENAKFFLDEILIGNTPLNKENIDPGLHPIKAESDKYFYNGEVEINAGKTVDLNISMERKTGNINITANPDDAEIIISGENKGKSLSLISNIPTGEVVIEMVSTGFMPWKETVEIKFNETISLNPILKKAAGTLKVISDPFGAEVLINNVSKGITPFEKELLIGDYDLKIISPKHKAFTKKIFIKDNETLLLDEFLERKKGFLSFNNLPPGTEIFVNDKLVGKTPLGDMELDMGKYSIDLKKKGYETEQIQNMSLRYNDTLSVVTTRFKPKTMPKAFLRSLIIPGWGQEYSEQKGKGNIINRSNMVGFCLGGYYYYQYTLLRSDFKTSQSGHEIADYNNKLNKTKRLRNIAMASAGIFYVGNIVDAILLGGYQPDRENNSRKRAIILSLASPGLGQMYLGYETKGLFWYMGMGASLAGIIYTTDQYYNKYSNYEQAQLIHNQSLSPEETFVNMQSAYDEYIDAKNIKMYSYITAGTIYALNLVDTWYTYSHLNKNLSINKDYRKNINVKLLPSNNGINIMILLNW